MTQLQPINNHQITTLTEFVDSVFAELEAWQSEYSSELSPSYYSSKDGWNDTLIPLAVRVFELAKSNEEICWWLLQKMSRIELCKDGREFRKTDLFNVLTRLKEVPDFLKMILRNCLLKDEVVLQQAIEEGDIDGFRNTLNQTEGLIFDVGRVLRRAMAISDIYKNSVAGEEIETLPALFWLIRRLLLYFPVDRSCDAMAYNLFVALNISLYSDNESEFCELLTKTGGLWIGSLMMETIKNKDQMPQAVSQAMNGIFKKHYSYWFDKLEKGYGYCDTDEQRDSFDEEHGGCLEIEKYSFIYSVLESGPFFLPPFEWKKWRPAGVRYWKNSPKDYRYHIVDPLLKNWLTIEDLEALKAQEVHQRVVSQESVIVSDCDPKPSIKDMTKELVNEVESMGFPKNIAIKTDKRKRFLEILHSKLCSSKFLRKDSLGDFVFFFGGIEDVQRNHRPVDWQKDKSSLQAFCSAFYDMPNMKEKKPWSKLTVLFTLNGEPIKKLSENANQVYGKGLEERMKDLMESALKDLEKEM